MRQKPAHCNAVRPSLLYAYLHTDCLQLRSSDQASQTRQSTSKITRQNLVEDRGTISRTTTGQGVLKKFRPDVIGFIWQTPVVIFVSCYFLIDWLTDEPRAHDR